MSVHIRKTRRMGGSPDMVESYERVTYCERCGGEYPGDPSEFPYAQFPCAATTWIERVSAVIENWVHEYRLKRRRKAVITQYANFPHLTAAEIELCIYGDNIAFERSSLVTSSLLRRYSDAGQS